MWVEHGDERRSLLALVNEVKHVAGVTPEPIEAGDYQFVARAQGFEHGGQLGSAIGAPARHLF